MFDCFACMFSVTFIYDVSSSSSCMSLRLEFINHVLYQPNDLSSLACSVGFCLYGKLFTSLFVDHADNWTGICPHGCKRQRSLSCWPTSSGVGLYTILCFFTVIATTFSSYSSPALYLLYPLCPLCPLCHLCLCSLGIFRRFSRDPS